MNLDTFQKKRLEAYFTANATDEVKTRREEKKLTIDGAYKWLESKLKKMVEDGEIKPNSSGCVVGDDQWCYDEVMHYFAVCDEGDTFKTEAEIKAEEERIKAEEEKRKEKAVKLWKEHAERVAKWANLTPEQIAEDIERIKYLRKHPWEKELTPEEIAERQRKALEEQAKRNAEAEEKEKKEAEKKRKAEEKEAKAKAKAEQEERKRKLAEAQMTLF